MSEEPIRGTVTLVNPDGLHLRPLTTLVRETADFDAEVSVSFAGNVASTKSAMELMVLGAACGSTLAIEATGAQAAEAMEKVIEILSRA